MGFSSRLILLCVGCFHLCPSPNGYILQLFNLIYSLPCRPVKEEPEPSEADAPGRWPSTYMNRTPPTPSESATTVKSLIKSFDLGRPGIVSFCLISKTQIQTIASWIQPVSAALFMCCRPFPPTHTAILHGQLQFQTHLGSQVHSAFQVLANKVCLCSGLIAALKICPPPKYSKSVNINI